MSKKVVGALVVLGLGLLGSAGADSTSVRVPVSAEVANVCAYRGQEDMNGQSYTDNEHALNLGTYRATGGLMGSTTTEILCTKGTEVTRSYPTTFRLYKNGDPSSPEYLETDVSHEESVRVSNGQYVPSAYRTKLTFMVNPAQFGATKGSYYGEYTITYTYY